jgi:hypothetical protein
MSSQLDRQKAEIEEALEWDWTIEIAKASDGEFALTIKELPGFFVAHHEAKELRGELKNALRAELRTYQLAKKEFPFPAPRIVVSDTSGGGDFIEAVIAGFAAPRPVRAFAATG